MRVWQSLVTVTVTSMMVVPALASAASAAPISSGTRAPVSTAPVRRAAKPMAEATPVTVSGVITAVNTAGRTITIQTVIDGKTASLVLPIGAGTAITMGDKAATLADLKPGYTLAAQGQRTGDTLTIAKIAAAAPQPAPAPAPAAVTTSGVITAVDPTGRTVTIQTVDNGKSATLVLSVGTTTKITLDGKAATLAGLKSGFGVDVRGTKVGDKITVEQLNGTTPPAPQPGAFGLGGVIASVDLTARTVTVQPFDDAKAAAQVGAKATSGTPVVLPVGTNTKITLDGKAATLAGLKSGFGVDVRGTKAGDKITVEQLNGTTPPEMPFMMSGSVGAVNAAAGTLTVNFLGDSKNTPSPLVLRITGDTLVKVNDTVRTLTDIKAGFDVAVMGTQVGDQFTVEQINAAAPRLEPFATYGTIGAVNVSTGTISLQFDQQSDPKAPPFLVAVPTQAVIRVNGQAATLADLKVGMQAAVLGTRNGDKQIAEQISAVARVATPIALNGRVTAVDTTARTLTVQTDDPQHTSWKVTISQSTLVKVSGKAAEVGNIKVGFNAMILGSVLGNTITADRVTTVTPMPAPEPAPAPTA